MKWMTIYTVKIVCIGRNRNNVGGRRRDIALLQQIRASVLIYYGCRAADRMQRGNSVRIVRLLFG